MRSDSLLRMASHELIDLWERGGVDGESNSDNVECGDEDEEI